jgi:DNA-binding CsgD family transcriptional regulator
MQPDVEAAIDAVLEAAVAPDQWTQALDRLSGALGAAGSVIVPREPQLMELGFPTSRAIQDLMDAFVGGGWHRNDIRADRAWPRFAAGASILVEDDLTTAEERRRSPYYQELFGAFGLPWWAGMEFKVDGCQWCLVLLRGAAQGPYSRADVAPFVEVAPHLRRAVVLASKFRSALAARTLDILAALELKAAVLDGTGLVVDLSSASERLLGDDLRLVNRRLTAARPGEDDALQAVLRNAVAPAHPASQSGPSVATITRDGRLPLLVEGICLPAPARDAFSRVAGLVIFHDLERATRQPAERARALFGLTAAEARVAAAVGSGLAPQKVADELGLAESTVRSVLKQVFAKTGVSRQSELVALLAKLPRR